jgi:hypothetical protein
VKAAEKPRVDLDATSARLARLGLDHAAERLEQHLTDGVKRELSAHALIDGGN